MNPMHYEQYRYVILRYLPSITDIHYMNIAVVVHNPRTGQVVGRSPNFETNDMIDDIHPAVMTAAIDNLFHEFTRPSREDVSRYDDNYLEHVTDYLVNNIQPGRVRTTDPYLDIQDAAKYLLADHVYKRRPIHE